MKLCLNKRKYQKNWNIFFFWLSVKGHEKRLGLSILLIIIRISQVNSYAIWETSHRSNPCQIGKLQSIEVQYWRVIGYLAMQLDLICRADETTLLKVWGDRERWRSFHEKNKNNRILFMNTRIMNYILASSFYSEYHLGLADPCRNSLE